MAARSTKDLKIWLEKEGSTPTTLIPTAITEAKPAVVTVANAVSDGDSVYCSLTGYPELDGKWFVVASSTGTEFTLLGSDTTGTAGSLDASPSMDVYESTDMQQICWSSLTLNVDEPTTISVATFCDPTASIASAVQEAGTLSFAGFVNILDEDYQQILAAENDDVERILQIELPSNGYLVAPITLSQVVWDLPIDGAVGYTGTAVLGSKMRHRF